jgi:translation initiation factor IF-1
MPGADAFQVEGVVLTVHSERVCRLRLANGHELTGFMTRRTREALGSPRVGQQLIVQLSPYDLSEARILGVRENE